VAADDIVATIREIQERVRSRYPTGSTGFGQAPLADLMPVAHARDAAEAKVAAIGSVNPRAPGLFNNAVQAVKKLVARALDWHVREQIEFNRGVMQCVEATLGALNEHNRALAALAARTEAALDQMRSELRDELREGLHVSGEAIAAVREDASRLREEAVELKDVRAHWAEWRQEWERKLSVNEVQFLRAVADLQGAFQHRVTLVESNFREVVSTQHREFTGALERSGVEVQKRLWEDLARVREEYERMIHNELRVIRQRAAANPLSPAPAVVSGSVEQPPAYDALRFADRFRGTVEYVKENQKFYLPFFEGCRNVLDIGCGRGEFLALAREAGIPARGIDLDEECVRLCRSQGLEAEAADLFPSLDALPHGALDGIFCGQVIEHLPPARLPEFVRLSGEKLRRGGVVAIETPNPECLAILATHFYLDPTHTRPVPPQLLVFFLEESGFGRIEVTRRFPAAESIPAVSGLPREFLDQFFGSLDYAVIARKL
jgi:O-antigen chain-terminating methyltransferase